MIAGTASVAKADPKNLGFGKFLGGSSGGAFRKLGTAPDGGSMYGSSSSMWINNNTGTYECAIDINFRVYNNKATATKKANTTYEMNISSSNGLAASRGGFGKFAYVAGGKFARGDLILTDAPFNLGSLKHCVQDATNLQQSYTGEGESTVIKLSFDYRIEDAIIRYTGIASKATGAIQSAVVIKGP